MTIFARGELALKLEPLIAARAKKNQGTRTDLGKNFHQNSGESTTDRNLAKIAGVSHDTIAKVKLVVEHAADWIDRNQLGRRNLTNDQYILIRGRRYDREKKRGGAPDGNINASKQLGQVDPVVRTSQHIAESLEMQNQCAEIKLRADRRRWQMLEEMPKHPPGPSPEVRSHDVTEPPSLADLGITKMQSSRWQAVASLPEPASPASRPAGYPLGPCSG